MEMSVWLIYLLLTLQYKKQRTVVRRPWALGTYTLILVTVKINFNVRRRKICKGLTRKKLVDLKLNASWYSTWNLHDTLLLWTPPLASSFQLPPLLAETRLPHVLSALSGQTCIQTGAGFPWSCSFNRPRNDFWSTSCQLPSVWKRDEGSTGSSSSRPTASPRFPNTFC